jgi:hypothetical protein
MPKKPIYDAEKVRKQKRLIGIVAVALLLIVTVIAIAARLNFIVRVLIDLVIAGVANLLLRRVGRVPL